MHYLCGFYIQVVDFEKGNVRKETMVKPIDEEMVLWYELLTLNSTCVTHGLASHFANYCY